MTLYGLWSVSSRDFFSYGGRVLVHGHRAELEWLFPGTPVREVPSSFPPEQLLPMAQHLAGTVEFPLRKEAFRCR